MAVVTQIQIRRGTAAQWTSANPTLASGEWGYETDTNKAKIGNGSTAWNSLAYIITGAIGTVTSVAAGTGLTGGTITSTGTIALNNTVISGYATTATAAGTTTLTASSATRQLFTGTQNQTIVLPVTSTLLLGTTFKLRNSSTGTLTVNSSGGNLIASIPAGAGFNATCILTSGTTAASWDSDFEGASAITGTGAAVLATSPTLTTPNIGAATGTSFNSITGLSSTNPAALGTVAVGTGTTTARADHVHPTTGLGLTASGLNQFAATTSAQLAGVISDETGSGSLVFGTSPTITGGTFADAVIRQTLLTPTFTTNAYTLALTDQGDILLASNGATAGTINIPTNASVAFPVGTQITIIQTGAGQLTIQATTPATTTIASTGATATAPKLRVINASATLIKTNTDAWYVVGDIS